MFDQCLAIDRLWHCVGAQQAVHHLLDRRAFDLCRHARKVEPGRVPGKIAVEVGDEFIERNRDARRVSRRLPLRPRAQ